MPQEDILPASSPVAVDDGKRLFMTITSLTVEMASASTRDDVLSILASWLPRLVPTDRTSITLAVDADYFEVMELEGSKAIPVGKQLPIANTMTGQVFNEKRVLRADDTSAISTIDGQLLAGQNLLSALCAPLINQETTIGTLNVAHTQPGLYTLEHETILLHVASVVAAKIALLDRFFTAQQKLEATVVARTEELEEQKVQLQIALEKERELNSLQRQFVSMVSHEFRTPLSIIDGNAQRLERRYDKTTTEQLLGSLGKIRGGVTRLTNLVEGVLSAARLESGKINYDPQPSDLISLISDTCSKYQQVYSDRQIHIDLKRLPPEHCVDVDLMRQVISNLVTNAIKYSEEGVHVWVSGETNDQGDIAITVRDEGPGIPAPELRRLFDRFFRASTSAGIIGTGVGLHVVRALVQMHGGNVDVASTVGEGSTFVVHLPANPPLPATSDEAAA